MIVTEKLANQTIDLPVGEVVEVRLEENPTTGFRWQLVSTGEPACSVVKDDFEPGAAPGQGGERSWLFKAVRSGECEVKLVYGRGWETAGPTARSFSFRVRVTR